MKSKPLFEIRKILTFEAAHKLPFVPPGHKCGRLHGHSFQLTVVVRGPLDQVGWVMDFSDIKSKLKPLIEELDHHYLNEIPGLENPTSEVLAQWFFQKSKIIVSEVYQIIVSETCTSECIYPVY